MFRPIKKRLPLSLAVNYSIFSSDPNITSNALGHRLSIIIIIVQSLFCPWFTKIRLVTIIIIIIIIIICLFNVDLKI